MEFGLYLLVSVAAALGALGGHLLKEILPSVALEDWKARRQLTAVFRKYRDPIVLAAVELCHRLEEIELEYPPSFLLPAALSGPPTSQNAMTTEDSYYRRYKLESSIYRLCAFLGWLELYRQEVVFLDSGKRSVNDRIDSVLKRVRAAMADGHLNAAQDWESWRDALIFREEQRAIGEEMITTQGDQRVVRSYGTFSSAYRSPGKPDWFFVADRFLLELAPTKDFRRTRLRLLATGLVDLVEQLEPSRLTDRLRALRSRAQAAIGHDA